MPEKSDAAVDASGESLTAEDLKRRLAEVRHNGRVEAPLRFDGATFADDVDFEGLAFAEEVSFENATFKGRAGFANCRFEKSASFAGVTGTDASFWKAVFLSTVSFRACTFDGSIIFDGAVFIAEATFDGAHFKRRATFTAALFRAAASFAETEFGTAEFSRAHFSRAVTFRGAVFDAPAIFAAARFAERADFTGTRWGPAAGGVDDGADIPADFRHVSFGGPAAFDGAQAPRTPAFASVAWTEAPSHAGSRGFDAELDRSFAAAPVESALGLTLSWETVGRVIQLLGAIAALVAWIVVVGGAVTWARLEAAGVPNPTHAVTLLPRDALIAEGIRTLALPLMLAVAGAALVYLLLSNGPIRERLSETARESWRARHGVTDSLIRPRTAAWFAALVLGVTTTVIVSGHNPFWIVFVFALVVVFVLFLAALAVAQRPSRGAVAAIAFVTIALIGGTLKYLSARGDKEPEFEPATIIFKEGGTLTGLLLARTDDRIAVICGAKKEERRVAIVPTDTAEYVGVRREVAITDRGKATLACGAVPAKDSKKDIAQPGTPPPDDRVEGPPKSPARTTPPDESSKRDATKAKTQASRQSSSGSTRQSQRQSVTVTVPPAPPVQPETRTVTETRVVTVTAPQSTPAAPPASKGKPRAPEGGRPSRNPLRYDREGFYLFGTHPFTEPVTGVLQLITVDSLPKRGWDRPRRVKLGTKAFRSDDGSGSLLRFRLSAFMRRWLRHGNHIGIEARITARGIDGVAATHPYQLPLEPA